MSTGSVSPQFEKLREKQNLAVRLRGFGPVGMLAIAIILAGAMVNSLVAAALVVLWVLLSKTQWPEVGYVRPGNYVVTIAGGVAFGAGNSTSYTEWLGLAPDTGQPRTPERWSWATTAGRCRDR